MACKLAADGLRIFELGGLRYASNSALLGAPRKTTSEATDNRLATLSVERLMQGIAEGANKNSTDRLEARLIMRNSA